MSDVKIYIYTDSRGGRLQNYVKQNDIFPPNDVRVVVQAGATIKHLINIMKHQVKSSPPQSHSICMVMAAGICSFTEKIKLPNLQFQITYQHKQENIEEIKNNLTNIYEYMSSHNIFFKAVHIPPSSLSHSKQYQILHGNLTEHTSIMTQEQMQHQQQLLEQAISNVNSHISGLNERYFRRSVRWDRNLLLCKQKLRGQNRQNKTSHTSIVYHNLYDGVHPTKEEASKWYKFLCTSLQHDVQDLVCSDSEVVDTPDTWDFKRVK